MLSSWVGVNLLTIFILLFSIKGKFLNIFEQLDSFFCLYGYRCLNICYFFLCIILIFFFFRKYDNFYEGEFVLYRYKILFYVVSFIEYLKDVFFVLI